MLFIEFDYNLNYGLNILKYRNIDDDKWYYLYIDIETLHLLVKNFGIISLTRIPAQYIPVDNPLTSKKIHMKYCDVSIEMYCGDKTRFHLPLLEQNY
jgi:hypothetical protein